MTTKINKLLQQLPSGAVATQTWLTQHGIEARLADKYVRSGWLVRVGHGAFARAGQSVDWPGALYALDQQSSCRAHPAGPSVLELRGYAHYLPMGSPGALYLFGPPATKLPRWIQSDVWSRDLHYFTPKLFNEDTYPLESQSLEGLTIQLPTLERAAFEMMWLVPNHFPFEEAKQLFETLTLLRPEYIQYYLKGCRSIQVKRLFLYCADRLKMPWFDKLELNVISLGSGPRTIHTGGELDAKYQLVIKNDAIQ